MYIYKYWFFSPFGGSCSVDNVYLHKLAEGKSMDNFLDSLCLHSTQSKSNQSSILPILSSLYLNRLSCFVLFHFLLIIIIFKLPASRIWLPASVFSGRYIELFWVTLFYQSKWWQTFINIKLIQIIIIKNANNHVLREDRHRCSRRIQRTSL